MEEPETYDVKEAIAFLSIVQLRIYDVMLALLESSNPTAARSIEEIHKSGGTISSYPTLKEGAFDED